MSLDKHNFSNLEKFELSETIPLVDKKTMSSLDPQYEDVMSNDADLAEVRLNYNNAWDRKSNGLTPDARKRFLEADKTYHRLTNNNMTIHISKRDVFKQAELYIKYIYYGEGDPASWPGCSYHNWGLAVDMARSENPTLIKALNEQGWTQTDDIGKWHFECTGSRDYEKAAKVIKSFRNTRTGLAYKWSQQVALYYRKRDTLNKRVPVFNKRLQDNKAKSQRLIAEIETFNVDAQNFKSTINRFNKDITKFNLELAQAEKLESEMMGMPDNAAKNKKSESYEHIIKWLKKEIIRIEEETQALNQENRDLRSRKLEIEDKIADYLREEDWLTLENRVLEKLSKEMEQHKSNATLHLMGIDNQTWK